MLWRKLRYEVVVRWIMTTTVYNYPSIGAHEGDRPLPMLALRKVGNSNQKRQSTDREEDEGPMAASIDGEWFAVGCSGIGEPNVIAIFEGRKTTNKKPARWLKAKSSSPIIDVTFTRAHSSQGSAFHRTRLVSSSERAVSVWDVQTGILLFEAVRSPLASPRLASVTNSCTVVLWQREARGVYEWNVGGDGVFITAPTPLERPCNREAVLCVAGGTSADCRLGICLATDRHIVAWRAGCPLLVDNSATAELSGKCEQLVLYHGGVAALLGFGKACLWSGTSGDTVVPVDLNKGPVERLFARNNVVYGYTETGVCMSIGADGCSLVAYQHLPENTRRVMPIHNNGYVVAAAAAASRDSLKYYDLLGDGGAVSLDLALPSASSQSRAIGCWVIGAPYDTIWKVLALSSSKAMARRMDAYGRDVPSDMVLNAIEGQTLCYMTGVGGRPGLVAGGTVEGSVMLWDLGDKFHTGDPLPFVPPPEQPASKVVDIRRCSVMTAFSRSDLKAAAAAEEEPLIIAVLEAMGAVRVLVVDSDRNGGLDDIREIIRLQSPSFSAGMNFGVVVELLPIDDSATKASSSSSSSVPDERLPDENRDVADEFQSIIFSCSWRSCMEDSSEVDRSTSPVYSEAWVVATGEREWQWESGDGWPRGMSKYLGPPIVSAGAFTLTLPEPNGFLLTAAVPGAGMKSIRSANEEATINALLMEKYCYVGLLNEEGWSTVEGKVEGPPGRARGMVDRQEAMVLNTEQTREKPELTRRLTVHPRGLLGPRESYRHMKEIRGESSEKIPRRSKSDLFPRHVAEHSSSCSSLRPGSGAGKCSYNAVIDYLLYGPRICPYFTDVLWVCGEALVGQHHHSASQKAVLLEDIRQLLRLLYFEVMDHCQLCHDAVVALCERVSLDFSDLRCIYFLGVCADVAPSIFDCTLQDSHKAAEVGHRLLQETLVDGDSVAAEILIRGYTRLVARVWSPERRRGMLVDAYRVYAREPRKASIALQLLLRAGLHDPLLFINTFSDLAVESDDGTAAVLVLASLLHRHPTRLRPYLPEFAEAAVLRCLDPAFPLRRRNCLLPATSALHEIVKTFPNTSFDQPTQRFAVAKGSVIVVYDLRTASKWRVLEGHTGDVSATAFDPTGTQLASYSAEDATLRVWQCGSTGFFGGILGFTGKCILTRQLERIPAAGAGGGAWRCRLSWRSGTELLLKRENNTGMIIKTSDKG